MFWLSLGLALALSGCATTPESTDDKAGAENTAAQVQSDLLQGDQAYRRGNTDQALFHYVTALNLDPDNTDLLYRIGMVHSENGDLDAADQAFSQILALNPEHAGALEGHGLVLLRQRKYDAAKEVLEKAVRLEQGRWRAQNGLGVISDIENDHALAITYYQLALEQRPGTPMVLNNLGYSYYLAGDWRSAEKAFNQAVNREPDHKKTWSNLGMLYVRKGRYDEAVQALSRVMSEPEAYNTMGYICMLEGKFDRAEAFFEEAIRLSPSYYQAAHENLARARARAAGKTRDEAETGHAYGLEVDNPAAAGNLP
ncbi:MAG: tetratricopeptide repeat protein [Gammaproteobacteria bacterium]|jgi:Flp pilus assembly protein TadD